MAAGASTGNGGVAPLYSLALFIFLGGGARAARFPLPLPLLVVAFALDLPIFPAFTIFLIFCRS